MCADHRSQDNRSATQYDSHLFTIRVWQEAIGQGEAEWRGRLQHVSTGQVYYFRSWDALIQHVLSMLPEGQLEPASPARDEEPVARQADSDLGDDAEHIAERDDIKGK